VAIAGESPIARALADQCELVGLAARVGAVAAEGDFACVVASLGHGDEDALRMGLEAGCDYVGLVASEVRGAAVLDNLRAAGVADRDVARVHTPAGVAIGAHTHAEIALSILAEIVAVRRAPVVPSAGPLLVRPVPAAARPREAVDPVCGMTVVVGPDTPMAGEVAFCCEGCREAWLARAGSA
jgi:xanthine dehydrogenase accessory factor